jgi:hypothetical protein
MKINLEDIKLLSANIQSFRLCHVLEIEKYIKKKNNSHVCTHIRDVFKLLYSTGYVITHGGAAWGGSNFLIPNSIDNKEIKIAAKNNRSCSSSSSTCRKIKKKDRYVTSMSV